MHFFTYKKGTLFCENIKVKDLAEKFDTPLYIYSAKTILDHFYKIKRAFSKIDPLICYSVKANSNLSILKILVGEGAGLDIVSGGELYRAKSIGCPSKRIVYAGVGKSQSEIKEAIRARILIFNVESRGELEQINRICGQLGTTVSVCIRINPGITPKTHRYVTTGRSVDKFGLQQAAAKQIFLNAKDFPNVRLVGIHMHIGSQIVEARPFVEAIKKLVKFIEELRRLKISLEWFNIGGGLGIIYRKERPQTAEEYAREVLPLLKRTQLKVILEPGRFIAGNSGILVTRILYAKETRIKKFLIVDAGMNDLIRPSLYEAYHEILPVRQRPKAKEEIVDVVGPVCESGDFLGKNRKLAVKEGDFLVVLGCGAYGFSMSSNYNSRPRAAEVLVKNNRAYLVRKRENYRDLVNKEILI